MTVHRVDLARCMPTPWANGGGQTRELLAWPQAQGWSVRVSVAAIERAGPFSTYVGVQRWLAMIEGGGVVLTFPRGEVILTAADPPLQFDGAAAPDCRLIAGASQDLNLMVCHPQARAAMRHAGTGSSCDGGAIWRALYAADAAVLELDGTSQAIPGATLLWSDAPDAAPWQLRRGGRAWWMELRT